MALKKNAEMKRVVTNLLKVGAVILSMATLFACGDDSGNSSKADNEDNGREVATLVEMGRCTSEREGDTVYVAEKLTDYLCRNGSWIDLSKSDDSDDETKSSSSMVPGSSSVIPGDSEKSSSSFNKDKYTDENLVVKKRSILGVAQKGPFKFGSPVYLRELSEETLDPTGMVYEDEISSNKGDFVIPNVNLISPYAGVEVRGQYRNEVTGEYSKDSISLFVLTDLKTDSRTKVNINLLTHLEYKRAMYLVRKGYSVYAAKKQADQEIMTAFELPTTVKYSEDLSVFEDSEDDNVDYANASLMMLNLLFLGNRSDTEIKIAIDRFIADIEKDGSWEDDSTKAVMADFATEIDGDEIRANVKSWNILDVPSFEAQVEMFWNNVYGLGGCTSVRSGVIAQNKNKYSKNVNSYYLCKSPSWKKITNLEADTYGWDAGETGEVKKGTYTEAKYVYRGGAWAEATALEYDTYGWDAGETGEVKKGTYTDAKYVYRNGKWNAASTVESTLGSCTASNARTIVNEQGTYYVCESSQWKILTTLEADTYGWSSGTTGEVRKGNITDAKYVYRNSTWNVASTVESALGSCTTKNAGTVSETGSVYYICKSSSWTRATALEYDTYGYTCSKDGIFVSGKVNENNKYVCDDGSFRIASSDEIEVGTGCGKDGTVVDGSVSTVSKYVCDGGSFRIASSDEIELNLGCTSYTRGKIITTQSNESVEERWVCSDQWKFHRFGIVKDSRDNKTYRTVTIGSQTWMAENLNYDYNEGTAKSYCYNNKTDSCAKYGRLYTWAAAMDSAGAFSTAGEGCGYYKICSASGVVRGVCPEGWHLPSSSEVETLMKTVGSIYTETKLKSTYGWKSGNGTDDYGFSALPAGYYNGNDKKFDYLGSNANFWSATEGSASDAYNWYVNASDADLNYYGNYKSRGFSVRCLQDQN